MEAEVLRELKEIRGVLWLAVIIIGIGVFFWILKSISVIYVQFHDMLKNGWSRTSSDLFELGKYDDLVKHCDNKLDKFPNDSHALWWLARANLGLKNSEKALELFEKVAAIEPTWKDESITPYINEIKSNG